MTFRNDWNYSLLLEYFKGLVDNSIEIVYFEKILKDTRDDIDYVGEEDNLIRIITNEYSII